MHRIRHRRSACKLLIEKVWFWGFDLQDSLSSLDSAWEESLKESDRYDSGRQLGQFVLTQALGTAAGRDEGFGRLCSKMKRPQGFPQGY